MPIRYSDDDYRRHDNEDYSFVLRPDSSRDFARRRRFGTEDDDFGQVMSQVSSPLRLPQLGKPQRQRRPAYESYTQEYSPSRRTCSQRDISSVPSRRHKMSGAARQALALCGELDEDDAYYKARRNLMAQTPESFEEDDYSEKYFSSKQRNRPASSRDYWEDEEEEDPPRRQKSKISIRSQAEIKKEQNPVSRKRDYDDDVGYVVPSPRSRPDDVLAEEQPALREITSYMAKRKQFAVEDDEDIQKIKNKKYQYRTRGPYKQSYDTADDTDSRNRRFAQAPMFDMKLRSHVVWEKMYVKFTCTIRGNPDPKVTWYHNMVAIEPSMLHPGTMKISSQFGVHTLEIFQARLEDSGTYRVSAQNHKGEISSYATLLVRRYDGGKAGYYDVRSGYNIRKPTDYPDVEKLDVPGYPRFVTKLFNKKINEGDAVVLSCQVDGKPSPDVFWTLNGRNLDDKINHIRTGFDGKVASLSILRAYCDDEGEYICRAYNSCGASTSKCFLSVHGVNGPPSAPSCLQYSDVTRNYVVLNWKPPGYTGYFGGSPVIGYFIEKAITGSSVWKLANQKAVKLTKTPVTCLQEGEVYFFRVRAVNRWGRGPPSMPVGPIATRDPGTPRLDLELMEPGSLLPPETDDVFIEEEDAGDEPGIPSDVLATLAPSGDSVFVSWTSPDDNNITGYHIESCDVDNDDWLRVTNEPLQTTDPYPVTGLVSGKSYRFRVRAVNDAGQSEPSDSTQTVSIRDELQDSNMEPEEIKVDDNIDFNEDYTDEKQKKIQDQPKTSVNKDPPDYDIKYRGPPTPPRDVQCLTAKREYIEVGWTPPARSGGEQVKYFVEYRNLAEDSWHAANFLPIRYTQYPVGELEEGDMYMFRVRCVNKFGCSIFSEPSEPILASDGIKRPNWWGGVQGLFRVADDKGKPCVTKNSIKVCWEVPSTDGGSNVTGYYLEYRPCGGKFRPVNNKPLSQRHFTVDNLNEGEYYQFRVRACNVVGCGEWKTMPGSIQAKDPEKPSPPYDVTITEMSEDSVSMTWRKPCNMGDGEFVGYLVERRKEDTDFWIPCNKLPEQVQGEEYSVSGLIHGQTYFFRVRAVNQVGDGSCSLQSCFVTIGEPFDDVVDRQNMIRELANQKKAAEAERLRLLEEQERKEAFSSKIEDCYVNEGSQGKFECRVKHSSTKVKWYLGNWKEIAIKPIGKYDVISCGKRRTLLINNCSISDVQAVHCVAMYNECTSTADLVVGGNAPVRFLRLPRDVFVKTGEKAVMDCVISKPSAKVTWEKYEGIISSDDDIRYEIVSQGCGRSFIINDVTSEDVSMYTIKGLGGSYTVNLVVDGVLPVNFEKKIAEANLPHTAEVAVFECLAAPSPLYGETTPPCVWYHGDEMIESDDEKYEIISDGNKHILKILKPTHEDNGVVTCVVGGGKTTSKIYVEKPPPPPPKTTKAEDYIINFEQGLRAEALAESMRLYCIVTNLHDDAKIIWYHNDKEIQVDNEKYKNFNNSETGLVSLVIQPITDDLAMSKFTCEFITPLSTFDTKVNYDFDSEEFKKILTKSSELYQEEENERKARKQEREKKKQDRKRSKVESEGNKNLGADVSTKDPHEELKINVAQGIHYNVKEDGSIEVFSRANISLEDYEIKWLKESQPITEKRFHFSTEGDQAIITIKEPCSDDAGTYTCLIQSTSGTKCETSLDFTGKVFKQILLKSAEIRIQPESSTHNDSNSSVTDVTKEESTLEDAMNEGFGDFDVAPEPTESSGNNHSLESAEQTEVPFIDDVKNDIEFQEGGVEK